ncbi:MAG: sigma-54 dependent transcriptional regulator [Mediterranea sp.]|jgi:DNA-binding NtrC family response regulator|nr:sigma-54 dependent transcriptional regulator [Mediterranea sp.]
MEQLGKILIVDDNEDVLFALNLLLEPYAEKIKVATCPDRVEGFVRTFQPDLILLDMNFTRDVVSGQEGFEMLEQILAIDPQAVVIFMTAYADTEKAVRAIKAGATDFIPKPWEREKLLATLSAGIRLRRSRSEVSRLKEQVEALSDNGGEETVIGQSAPMQEVFSTVEKLGTADANILILGENGTGKDVIARLIYRHSTRHGQPFVSIDLGSIPETLFESELFGYEKGAFTDARKAKAGRMEAATGGTLFLDEIGNLSLPMQAKLLTAIEKRQISRLGGVRPIAIDVRLLCATNADIYRLVEEGQFRQDLLYRINTIELRIPPLRERGNDILLLAEHFLARYARKYRKPVQTLTREAREKLLRYPWPGNVRELQNAMERAVILGDGRPLRPEHFVFQAASSPSRREKEELLNLEQLERQAVERALKRADGNLTRAAEYLGITRFALYRKLQRWGLA